MQGNLEKEVKINLQGEIIGIETEEDEKVLSEELEKINGIITEAKAEEIALGEVDGIVIGIEAEREGGRLLYEVEIRDGEEIAEVEINAETGEVLEVEYEDEEEDEDDDD